jgi:hypothetical protein
MGHNQMDAQLKSDIANKSSIFGGYLPFLLKTRIFKQDNKNEER